MRNENRHLTTGEIVNLIQRAGTPVGVATVYRVLKQLEAEGLARKYFLGEGTAACYQFAKKECRGEEHYHLLCSVCGGVTHADSGSLKAFTRDMLHRHSFAVENEKTVFYGVCAKCLPKKSVEEESGI